MGEDPPCSGSMAWALAGDNGDSTNKGPQEHCMSLQQEVQASSQVCQRCCPEHQRPGGGGGGAASV